MSTILVYNASSLYDLGGFGDHVSSTSGVDGICFLSVVVCIVIGESLCRVYAGSRPLSPEPLAYECVDVEMLTPG